MKKKVMMVDVYKIGEVDGGGLSIKKQQSQTKANTLTSRYFASGIVKFKGTTRILEYEEESDTGWDAEQEQ